LKDVFHDPGFAVQGATRRDQAWISATQETGIRVLGWARPKGTASGTKPPPKAQKQPPERPSKQGGVEVLPPMPRPAVGHPAATPAPSAKPPHKPTLSEQVHDLNQRLKAMEGK
jgi:hypothetical protein